MADLAPSALVGKRLVITRAVEQTSELFELLCAHGATPIPLPLVCYAPALDPAPLDAALQHLDRFDWAILTSANVVTALLDRRTTPGRHLGNLPKPHRIGAVGPATARAAKLAGLVVDHVAKTHLGVALAEELGEQLRGKTVFLPRSDRANRDLPTALRRFGAEVTEVVAYRNVPPADVDRARVSHIVACEADAILFFSPSAVDHLASITGTPRLQASPAVMAAVGPVTAAALRQVRVERIVVAADTTPAAVVAALEAHFAHAAAQRPTAGARLE